MSKQNIVKSFGNANTGSGTVIKFTPFTSTDTMLKRGVTVTINTQHNCITFMKEYENKSLEELRYEDFLAGRTGPQQTKSSVWLQKPGTWPNTSTRTGIFGNPKNNFLFSLPYTGFASTGVLGSQPQQTNSIFGKPVFAATTSATGSGFNATHTKNTFGSQQKPVGTAAPQTPFLFRTATSPFASAFTDQQNNKQMTTTNVFNEKPKQTSVGGFGADLFSTAQNTSESSAVKSQFSFNQSRTATSSAKVKRGRRIVGKSAFGAATTSATGFGFNTTPTTNTFGSQQKPVGTAAPHTPYLFGTATFQAPSIFPSAFMDQQNNTQMTTTNVFNEKPKQLGTFGLQTSVGGFGGDLFSTAQNISESSAVKSQFSFNQSTTSTTSTIGFGNANTGSGTDIKFTPFTSTETQLKHGVGQRINTRHNCITFMKGYENKSLEELRYEDFLAGRTGPHQTKSSVWLQKPGTWPNTSTGTGIFGNSENKFLFSVPNTAFPSTGVLGSQPQQTNNIFGKPEFGATTTSATGSGFNATPTTNTFGSQQKPVGRSDKDLEIATNVKHGNDVNSIKMSGLTSLFDFESPKMLYKESWKTSSSCECEAMHSQDLEELKLSVKSLSDRLDKLLLFNNQNECHTKDKSTNISLVPWSLFNPKLNLTEKKVPKDTEVQWLARILNGVIQTVSEQDRKEIYLLMVLVSTWPSLPDYVKTFIYNRMNILWQNENQKANCSSVVNERQP